MIGEKEQSQTRGGLRTVSVRNMRVVRREEGADDLIVPFSLVICPKKSISDKL